MNLKSVFILAIVMCFTLFTVTAQTTITSNQTGTDGMWYTFWTDGGGSVSMQLLGGGHFRVNWSNCGNFVCGKGWSTGSTRTITWSGSASGAQYFGVYGWMQNPLVEYYIPRSGGSRVGTYSADGTTYTLNTAQRVNQPSIEGTATFTQYFCSGSNNQSVNFGQHVNGWRSLGQTIGSQNYQVVAVEGWGGSSGSADVTVGSGSSSTTTTSSGYTTTSSGNTTTSSGGTGNINVRARGATGNERIEIMVNGSAVASYTVSTSYQNYNANGTGTVRVAFTNDDGGDYDVQVDYITINGTTYQAEDQATNTGVYQDGSCGGSYSEWLHCNGYIEFSGGGTTTPVPSSTTSSGWSTTTSSSSSGGGQTCSPATSQSVPFTQNGAGEYCFSTSSNINYINSWNMDTLTVNGTDFTNTWASGSSLPAKIDGRYYIVYKGSYGWSHFEAR
jgi:endo-1,4-beta-xylanase